MGGRTGPVDPATAGPMFAVWCLKTEISEVINSKNFSTAAWQDGVSNCWTGTGYGMFM